MDETLRALIEDADQEVVSALATMQDCAHPTHTKAVKQICRDLRDVSAQMSELLALLE